MRAKTGRQPLRRPANLTLQILSQILFRSHSPVESASFDNAKPRNSANKDPERAKIPWNKEVKALFRSNHQPHESWKKGGYGIFCPATALSSASRAFQ